MIKSLFRQIWNQRYSNAWVWMELMVVLVLLWYGVDLVYNYEAAAIQPKGYDTENVFDVELGIKSELQNDSVLMSRSSAYLEQIYKLIQEYRGVEEACFYYGTIPYSKHTMHEGYAPHSDSTHLVNCYIRYVSPTYFKVFRLKPSAGTFEETRWREGEYPIPVMMSVTLSDSLFGDRGCIGATCFNPYFLQSQYPVTNYKVMTVLPAHKTDDYERYKPFIYLPSSTLTSWHHIAVRVSPDATVGFKERFMKEMQVKLAIGPYYLYDMNSYADMKEAFDIEEGTVNYLNTAYAVIVFFIFNVFLGMLGTFWFRTRKRAGEIALRMAMGSSRIGVFIYYSLEGILLLLSAAVPAVVICIHMQLADLNVHTLMDATSGRFVFCFLVALLLLVVIILLGIWFPARQAMQIQLAEALHGE